MSQNKELDPSKLFVATKLVRDENGSGVLIDEHGDWKSGKLFIQLFDSRTGLQVAGVEKDVSRAKYLAFREDFDPLTTEEVVKEYFKVPVSAPSESELQASARVSHDESAKRAAEAPVEEEKFTPLSAGEVEEATPEDVEVVVTDEAKAKK